MGNFKKLLNLFEKGWYYQYFYRMRLKWFFCWKILKNFKLWILSEKQVRFLGFFPKSINLASLMYNPPQIVFLLKNSQNVWILDSSRKISGFFQKRKISKKLWNASQIVIMLKKSQNVQILVFLEERMLFSEKKLDVFEKLLNLANFLHRASRIVLLLMSSQNVRNWFFLRKKTECSKKFSHVFENNKQG